MDQEAATDMTSYVDMMERNSAEERRRQRERIMMEEGKALWRAKKSEDLEMELKEQEQIRELARLKHFGRPGHGAPTENIRKKKFTEYQFQDVEHKHDYHEPPPPMSFYSEQSPTNPSYGGLYSHPSEGHPAMSSAHDLLSSRHRSDDPHDALTFGRPGCGAPVRTKSGRVRTTVIGAPEIRFQENESVKKSIFNSIRYQSNPETKAQYQRELEEQIRQRKEFERTQKEREISLEKQLEQVEGNQWGRPGPGGKYWRDSAVTGQGFFDKMGWCGSADPRKRNYNIRHHEAEDMKKEIEEVRQRRDEEHQEINNNVGVELVPLLKEKATGKPRKDPTTGYLMNHGFPSTDVTQLIDSKKPDLMNSNRNLEEKRQYFDTLHTQVQVREQGVQQRHKDEQEEQKRHFESWERFWGKPGYGAPRDGRNQKENLMKILHYPELNKAPNNVELITLERLPVK
ncbi:uncharacterized protein LOC131893000 isoform X2 [Tigriopus californicus]|uniref:uncharacterized protein LOC131893000 isoform X2 n=1 Tax=Tigriopus californicus TaxID=6832 RepID=UPI0027DA6002|nr:uncharacterized protein LOC131893000 isoform X2 [Tigriopus californicus]